MDAACKRLREYMTSLEEVEVEPHWALLQWRVDPDGEESVQDLQDYVRTRLKAVGRTSTEAAIPAALAWYDASTKQKKNAKKR